MIRLSQMTQLIKSVVVFNPWCSFKVSNLMLGDFVRISENLFVTEDRKQSNPAIIIGTRVLLVIQGLGMVYALLESYFIFTE